ncbi:hypothetical protein ACEZDB_01470 [Streptacidiphilus sp. N1-3]|uniref:Uncharacterized protein n=1 Tax=Streptacidiphilus alkalitolerans TaxID=3342712 RepID=A0ABV6WUA2_9ACTN
MRDLSAGDGSSGTSGRHTGPWAGPVLLLTLGLLLGSSGCAAKDAETDGSGPGSQRVSFLPGEPVSTTLPVGPSGATATASGTARATAGPTPRPTPTAARQLKRTPGASPATRASGRTAQARRAPAATGYDARLGAESAAGSAPDFLPLGACAAADPSAGAGAYQQVRCDAPTATATVVGRFPAGGSVAACPPATDFALQLTTTNGSGGGSGTAARPSGIACLRNLHGPHPGDPGGGGGIGIVPGDCLYLADGTRVQETACDGSGPHAPDYRVNSLVARESDCPAGTGGYIAVRNPGAAEQTACAVLLHHG